MQNRTDAVHLILTQPGYSMWSLVAAAGIAVAIGGAGRLVWWALRRKRS